jgi:hypothetical protein
VILFFLIWIYVVIAAIRIRKYYPEIKLKAKEEGLVLPMFRENIFDKFSTVNEIDRFYINWFRILDTDTRKRKRDKIYLNNFFKRGRLILKFMIFWFAYIIVTMFIMFIVAY